MALVASVLGLQSPAQAAVPSAPRNCAATLNGNGDVVVTWDNPSNNGGKAVQEYRVREQGYTSPVVSGLPASARSYTWTNVLRDTADQRMEVRAVNADGGGPWCTTPRIPPPNSPPVVSVTGFPVNGETEQTVVLDSSPFDPEGDPLTITWSKVSGPGTLTVLGDHPDSLEPGRTVNAKFSAAGTYTVKVAVTDSANQTASATGTVNITDPPASNQAPTVSAGPDRSVVRPNAANLDGTVSDDGLPAGSSVSKQWTKVSGPGVVTFGSPTATDTTATFDASGTYVLRLTASDGALSASDEVTVTVTDAPVDPILSLLPYTADSFYKSRVDGPNTPIDAGLTAEMHNFMATYTGTDSNDNQSLVSWPKLNQNPGWSGHNYVHRSDDTAPIWKLTGTAGSTDDPRLDIVRTQGIHLTDATWNSVPTGTQDRLLVIQDHVFGYTVQCADVVPNMTARTWTASNCGIMWHSSNGLNADNPLSNDPRNFTSRGRIIDAMQVPREEIDRAVANNTGVGHVLHLFWVSTDVNDGFSHPMTNEEDNVGGWGGEGWRLRIKPSVDLQARGLTGAALAIARTLQQNGAYIGDNAGGVTQVKIGPPEDYVGTNITTDAFKNKITWNDFEVVQPGWQ